MRQYVKQLYIDSRDTATNGSTHNYTAKLARPIEHVHRIIIKKVVIPFSYYVFNSNNNNFVINEGGGDLTVTITPGNYTLSQFETALKTALDAAGGDTYTVSVDTSTYKVTISSTGTFELVFTSGASAYKQLGFLQLGTYTTAASHTSPYAINLNGPSMIYIKSKELTNGTIGKANWILDQKNILYGIQVDKSPNEIIYSDIPSTIEYTGNEGFMSGVKGQNNRNGRTIRDIDLQVVIVDQFRTEELLDLNGVDWSMVIDVVSYDD